MIMVVIFSGLFFLAVTLGCLFVAIHIREHSRRRDEFYNRQFKLIDNAISSYNESVKSLIEQVRVLSNNLKQKA